MRILKLKTYIHQTGEMQGPVTLACPPTNDWTIFTGMTDKNKVELYNGDIVKAMQQNEFGSVSEKIGYVKYIPQNAMYVVAIQGEKEGDECGWPLIDFQSLERIGNVWTDRGGLLKFKVE